MQSAITGELPPERWLSFAVSAFNADCQQTIILYTASRKKGATLLSTFTFSF